MIIPNIWKNKKCSKPPTRYSQQHLYHELLGFLFSHWVWSTWVVPSFQSARKSTSGYGALVHVTAGRIQADCWGIVQMKITCTSKYLEIWHMTSTESTASSFKNWPFPFFEVAIFRTSQLVVSPQLILGIRCHGKLPAKKISTELSVEKTMRYQKRFFWSRNLEPDIYTVIPSGFWLQTTQRCW